MKFCEFALILLCPIFAIVHGIIENFPVDQCKSCGATVYINNAFRGDHPVFCAGALISRQIVLTCAACYTPETIPGTSTAILVGSRNPQYPEGEMYYVIDHRYIDTLQGGERRFYNLALLKLDRRVSYQKHVFPLALATNRDYDIEFMESNRNLVGCGYAYGDRHLKAVEELKAMRTDVIEAFNCDHYPFFKDQLTKEECMNIWCIGYKSGSSKRNETIREHGMNENDLGAPIVGLNNFRLYGISIHHEDMAETTTPTLMYVFTEGIRERIIQLARNMTVQSSRKSLGNEV